MDYKKALQIILVIFLVQVIIKIVLSSFIHSPTIFADEYDYIKMARSFFYSRSFLINGTPSHQYLPLYPIIISIGFIFKDMNIIYFLSKCINAVISSLIIFPAYLIAREFLTSKKALFTAIVVSVLPICFAFTPYIMSENLALPLILFSFYFIHKSFTQKEYKWDILAGLFIGLSYLTKIIGIILIPLVLILLIISLFRKEYFQIKKKIILFIITFLTIIPWLIRNIYHFGFNINGLLGADLSVINELKDKLYIFPFIDWIILHIGYITIATGIIFFIISLLLLFKTYKKDNKLFNLTLMAFIFLILITVFTSYIVSRGPLNYNELLLGRPIGRHITIILPLFIILGFIGLNKKITKGISNKTFLKITLFLFILLGISSQLNMFSLFPVNNMSLSIFGIMKYLLSLITNYSFIIMFIIFLLLSLSLTIFYRLNLLKFKTCFLIFIVYFILLGFLSYGLTYYNSEYNWMPSNQTKLGLWFNSYDKSKSTVLFDEECNLDDISNKEIKPLMVAGFWMNNDIIIGNETKFNKANYIFSCKELSLNLIKKTKEGDTDIFIYKK